MRKPKPVIEPKVFASLRLDQDLEERLIDRAKESNKSFSEVCREVMKIGLDHVDKK